MNSSQLPGGLLLDGELHRSFEFAPITGMLEREIAESGLGMHSLARQVTNILAYALDNVAGQRVTKKMIRMLSSGDREFLILYLHSLLEPDPRWITRRCAECDQPVQFQIDAAALPVKSAGEKYPQTALKLSFCDAQMRVPIGTDEEALADNCEDHDSAMSMLLKRLLTLGDENCLDQAIAYDRLTTSDLLMIDRVLDQMSPQISRSVNITCPYCLTEQLQSIDNYEWIIHENSSLDEQIHTLAFYYHWSEKEILSLPKKRRSQYVTLIERNLFKGRGDVDHSDVSRGGI
ncbi:MAG: hypothetical protein ACJAZP_001361 [Psychromonas sp.]|jgi:hypothetical protein|uniref:T4 family baseplate hub assembly chaperone n=1 Tax=Psychromonas sp. TaxID=1884585 RepID=UPI0039E417D8